MLAQEDARTLKHNYIGTEHILLGLLREEEGLAARVLESLDITVERVRAQVVRIVGSGEEVVTSGQIPFTPRAKKILELALREALILDHNYIGTEHILLGLARESEGVAARVLLDFGAASERIRKEVIRMLPDPGVPPPRRLAAVEGSTPATVASGSISVPRTNIRAIPSPRVRRLLMVAAARALDDGRSEIDVRDLLLALSSDEQTAVLLADAGIDLLLTDLGEDEAELRETIERRRPRKEPT